MFMSPCLFVVCLIFYYLSTRVYYITVSYFIISIIQFLCAIILILLRLVFCRHAYLFISEIYIQLVRVSLILYSQLTNLLILFKYTCLMILT